MGIESECARPPSISYSRYSVTVTWLLPYIQCDENKRESRCPPAPREPLRTSTLREEKSRGTSKVLCKLTRPLYEERFNFPALFLLFSEAQECDRKGAKSYIWNVARNCSSFFLFFFSSLFLFLFPFCLKRETILRWGKKNHVNGNTCVKGGRRFSLEFTSRIRK